MYFHGYGVEKDFVKAYLWLSLAARDEAQKANDSLEALARYMTPEQLDMARKLAGEWKPVEK
jgi:hypothetical protein